MKIRQSDSTIFVDDLDADAAADMELIWTLLSWQDNVE